MSFYISLDSSWAKYMRPAAVRRTFRPEWQKLRSARSGPSHLEKDFYGKNVGIFQQGIKFLTRNSLLVNKTPESS
jgi:hypothetical protein